MSKARLQEHDLSVQASQGSHYCIDAPWLLLLSVAALIACLCTQGANIRLKRAQKTNRFVNC